MALVEYLMRQAKLCLANAEREFCEGHSPAVPGYMLYAIFNAVQAVQALDDRDYNYMTVSLSMFMANYIETGIFPERFSGIIDAAFTVSCNMWTELFPQFQTVREFLAEAEAYIENRRTAKGHW